jgi:hypothetical protein
MTNLLIMSITVTNGKNLVGMMSYVDAHVNGKYDDTELGTFEFALSIVCNGIIEHNKSVSQK